MNQLKPILAAFLIIFVMIEGQAQRLYIGGGATLVSAKPEFNYDGETVSRLHIAYPDAIGKLGFYATLESYNQYANWAQKVDNWGVSYRLTPQLSAYYGRALINIMSHNPDKFPLTGRQDLGLSYFVFNQAIKLDAGYSFWSGPHFQISYGIPLSANDDDGDGVTNRKDKCAGTPAKYFESLSADGCPLDSDGDGIADIDDACPGQAGKSFTQGCPDQDNDGIADKDDPCPSKKGMYGQGCPDSDGDGIADDADNCPNEAGSSENNGCPVVEVDTAVAEPVDTKQFDQALADMNELKKALAGTLPKFDLNSSYLNASQHSALNKVAQLMKKNPKAQLFVEGYTDDIGTESYNLWLSKKRAAAVQEYLVAQGIDATRLNIKGFGETNFRVDGTSAEARAENRRVELKLIP